MRVPIRSLTSLLLLAGCALINAASAQVVAYGSLVDPLPGNVDSLCLDCNLINEFGDKVTLAPGPFRRLDSVIVTLSSWACERGSGVTCKTRAGKTFTHPVTLTLYARNPVAPDLPGTEIVSVTSNFVIPYRPSADSTCPDSGNGAGTAWRASPTKCYNGKAVNLEFDLHARGLTLPDTLIWSVTFDTRSAGYNPLGVPGPYDSLNVGVSPAATVGRDVDPNGAFVNSSDPSWYCDGGTGGLDVFRADTNDTNNCWAGDVPSARINVMPVPTTTAQCANNGWKTLVRANGSKFKNQAECEKFVKTGK